LRNFAGFGEHAKGAEMGLAAKKTFLGAKGIWILHLLMLVPVGCTILFSYVPMWGILMAFQNYSVRRGILGSEWVGFRYFRDFFALPTFGMILRNTIIISIQSFVIGFPFPILLALGFNEIANQKLKKTLQTISYAPYFVSMVVVIGMMIQLFHFRFGIINVFLNALGRPSIDFMAQEWFFRPAYIWTGVWSGAGYGSILYLASLSTVDPELHEAAIIDGATKIQRVWHIDLPSIKPTIVITLIMAFGGILGASTDKILLLQNAMNYRVSEVIGTYVYKMGLQNNQYGFASAVGIWNSLVNLILLIVVNQICKKLNETSFF
jgi:ABC-type polysaccharide transport system permease subunit